MIRLLSVGLVLATLAVSAAPKKKPSDNLLDHRGRIGVVSPKEGPQSFLGMPFGAEWDEPVDPKKALREIPFTPRKGFRDYDAYYVRLKAGRIAEVILEKVCGTKEAAAAEAAACVALMEKKYGCEFTGEGARRKATCYAYRRSESQQTKGRIVTVPAMEIEMKTQGAEKFRIVARTLDPAHFARPRKPAKAKADLDAL